MTAIEIQIFMIQLSHVDLDTSHAQSLFKMLRAEWPVLDSFKAIEQGVTIPPPIVALDEGILVGGLSFIVYQAPDIDALAVWVNAVYILPAMRNQGMARQLIEKAQATVDTLYALTDIPPLYTGLGWHAVTNDHHGTVVKYQR